jgi:hypothetical protein
MAPEALRSLYPSWRADEAGARKGARRGGLVLARPSADASAESSEESHAGMRRARG